MHITSIEKNSRNKDRLSVYVDESYLFSISEEDYIRLNLYEKREITQEEIDYIKTNLNFNSAKSSAIKHLALRIRTECEVRSRLEYMGYDASTVDSAVDELKSMGYLNDVLYVQKYLYDRSKLKPKSKKMLRAELQRKGIQEELIQSGLDEMEIDEAAIAVSLIKKKFGKYNLKDEKIIKRAYSFLRHRGFGFDVIEYAIASVSVENS
ncbi:regulatory protein [Anaerobacterium chartisolvens]|uniref:Regulatory protein RecX n=1 Tax=Anaerobacterium chartisolvens TaxID=1297424 RepID=A0A369BEM3_9FIRM|nr:regulatory protein RecX [Anaerobacterium chartisolvens]RCX20003.1 regulatory protein [Anaerobacterium chartisolvens]